MMQDYESERLLNEYLLMHFASSEQLMLWQLMGPSPHDFVQRTVEYFSQKPVLRSLDLGCAVGKASFLLSRTSSKVTGVDYSQRFIDAANEIKTNGKMAICYQEEGGIYSDGEVSLPDGVYPEHVRFIQGNALDLPAEFIGYDRVLASNLLCRLPDPQRFLDQLPRLLAAGGEVVLATPFSWLEEYTPRDRWPEGDSWKWLNAQMSRSFDLIRVGDEPFVIREHARKFQLGVARVSLWKLKI